MRFVAPPHWPPTPPGWQPPAGWQPPPEWGPAPEGWEFWQDGTPPRPSVWRTLGIAVATALVVGSALGGLVSGGDDVARSMGYGFSRLLIPALVIGGAWPWAARRVSPWWIPVPVVVLGMLLSAAGAASTVS